MSCPRTVAAGLALCLLVAAPPAAADGPEETPDADGDPYTTVVRASRTDTPRDRLPLAVTTVTAEAAFPGRPEESLADRLFIVPGLALGGRGNFAQDLRLSLRGFGMRSAFGVRGVTVILDGIPLTGPDGQSQLDLLDPALAERVEILRGPAAALWGNAAGGVVSITTARERRAASVAARGQVTADGRTVVSARAGASADVVGGWFAFSRIEGDGARDHSQVAQTTAAARLDVDLGGERRLRLAVDAIDAPVSDDPGGLTEAELEAAPGSASPLNLRFDAGEAVAQAQAGVTFEGPVADDQTLEAGAWTARRGFDGRVPFRMVRLDRVVYGARARHTWSAPVAGLAQRLSWGAEAQRQDDARENRPNEDGVAGEPLLLDQDERVRAFGVWIHEQVTPWAPLTLTGGLRWDRVDFEVTDRLLEDGDQSGARAFDAWSGLAGAAVAPARALTVYANVATGFETPTTTELTQRPGGGGGLNPDLEPARTRSAEVGARGRAGRALRWDAALFVTEVRDELVPYQDETERTWYRNAARSRRRGAEASLGWRPLPALSVQASASHLAARFEDYARDGVDLSGRSLPGLSPWRGAVAALWGADAGPFAGLDVEALSAAWADDANTVRRPAFALVGARVGWRGGLGDAGWQAFLGVENLLDARWVDNLRVNAQGGRYFEPGPGRRLYGGLGLSFAR